jgi:hypothetical protein
MAIYVGHSSLSDINDVSAVGSLLFGRLVVIVLNPGPFNTLTTDGSRIDGYTAKVTLTESKSVCSRKQSLYKHRKLSRA